MGDYSKAMEHYSKAESLVHALVEIQKSLNPLFLVVFLEMASIRREENRNTEAIQLYQKAIRLWNENEDAYQHLGKLYVTMNELDKAEECYNKILDFEPRSRDGLYNAAVIAYKKNRTVESLDIIEKCLKIYPNDNEALRLKLALEQNIRDTSELNRLLELLSETENDYQSMTQVGIIYKKRGHLENAEKYLNDAHKINATYDVALLNLAFIYKQMKEYEKSLAAVSSFLEVISDDVSAWQLLCELQAEHFRNIDAASMANKEAYRLNPDNVRIRNTFCILMFKKKDYEGAQICFEKLYQETKQEFVADGLRVVNKKLAAIKGGVTMH